MKKTLGILALSLLTSTAFAMPKEVVIIRHADTLDQKHDTVGLSAKGQVRAQNFAHYFMDKFGKPDVIVSSKPRGTLDKDSSTRELSTLAPLENLIAEQYPDSKPEKEFPLIFKYAKDDYKKLTKKLIKDKQFRDKLVVICWDRKRMDNIARELGAPDHPSPIEDEYDTVWDIKFDSKGDVKSFDVFQNQYPVNFSGTWAELFNLVN